MMLRRCAVVLRKSVSGGFGGLVIYFECMGYRLGEDFILVLNYECFS